MYADDTALVFSTPNLNECEKTINVELDKYFKWLCYNKLCVNVEKTVYMLVKQKTKKIHSINLFMNQIELKEMKVQILRSAHY